MFNKTKILFLLIFSFTSASSLMGQDLDIIPYLKLIESGNSSGVKSEVSKLKIQYPESPSLLFLEAVLIEDGTEAVRKFSELVAAYPESNYADAAVYRIYSYYFSLGLYQKAKSYLDKLKKEYPLSPYIKTAERNLPLEDDAAAFASEVEPGKVTAPSDRLSKADSERFKYKFTIQAGAFTNQSNAAALKKSFEEIGFFSEIKEKTVGGTVFNVVYVGKFLNEEEAKTLLQRINKEFNLNAQIISIN